MYCVRLVWGPSVCVYQCVYPFAEHNFLISHSDMRHISVCDQRAWWTHWSDVINLQDIYCAIRHQETNPPGVQCPTQSSPSRPAFSLHLSRREGHEPSVSEVRARRLISLSLRRSHLPRTCHPFSILKEFTTWIFIVIHRFRCGSFIFRRGCKFPVKDVLLWHLVSEGACAFINLDSEDVYIRTFHFTDSSTTLVSIFESIHAQRGSVYLL